MDEVVNSKRLKELVSKAGGTTVVAYEADVGRSTLEKLMAGTYESVPGVKLRKKLFGYFRINESEIFPFSAKGGKAS
jgi:hypothetical protein